MVIGLVMMVKVSGPATDTTNDGKKKIFMATLHEHASFRFDVFQGAVFAFAL